MCLSAAFFATFLTLIASERIVHAEPGRYIVRADTRPAHWVETGDRWCTMAPQIDRMERLAALQGG